MAKIRSGILGNTRGKVSGVVGSQWKDKNYIREYVKPANPQTTKQMLQRAKMTLCVAFAKPIVGPILNEYVDPFQKSMSGFNYFTKQNLVEFVPDPDHSKMVLTEGKLSKVDITDAHYDSVAGTVTILFEPAYGNNGLPTDQMYAAVYEDDVEQWFFCSETIDRSLGSIQVSVPEDRPGPEHEQAYILSSQLVDDVLKMVSYSQFTDVTEL